MDISLELGNSFKKAIDYLIDQIIKGNVYIVSYLLIIISAFFLFKEFRRSHLESKSLNLSFINDSIKAHSNLIITLSSYLNDNSSLIELNKSLENYIMYSQYEAMDLINNWLKFSDEMYLEQLFLQVKCDLNNLKEYQIFPGKRLNSFSSIYEIHYSLKKRNYDNLIVPLLHTTVLLSIACIIVVIIMPSINVSFSIRLGYFLVIITLFEGLILFISSMDLIQHKGIKNLKMLLLFSFIYIALLFLSFLSFSTKPIVPLIWLIYSWIYIPVFVRSAKK